MTDHIVEVDFGGLEDRLTLRWLPRPTAIGFRWLDALRRAIPLGIHERERFYNFPGDGWDRSQIAAKINIVMDAIAAHHGEVFGGLRAAPDMSQAHFNRLHTFFETLRGSVEEPAEFFLRSPTPIKRAIEEYNVLIHRWEDHEHELVRNQSGVSNPRLVVTFAQKQRAPLEDEDYQHFTFAHAFGAMRLNYCQVGKPLYDVWKDDDDDVGDEAIKPLTCYSADFNVTFGPDVDQAAHERTMSDIWAWFDRKSNFMNTLGFQKHDPKLALGHIVVADLIQDRDRQAIIDSMSTRRRVHDIRIVEAD